MLRGRSPPGSILGQMHDEAEVVGEMRDRIGEAFLAKGLVDGLKQAGGIHGDPYPPATREVGSFRRLMLCGWQALFGRGKSTLAGGEPG